MRRGCGTRQPGGAYPAVPLGRGKSPVEAFLVDPPAAVDAAALRLSAVGMTLVQRDGATVVGCEHYPTRVSPARATGPQTHKMRR